MKFAITATTSDEYFDVKDFQTIDELMRFKQEVKNDLIITINFSYKGDIEFVRESNPKVNATELVTIPYAIEIYDDYRE
jgi:hypothetical protein